MAVFNSYYDTSGTEHDSRVLATAGFMATAYRWGIFDSRWNAVLLKYEVSKHHMVDFAQGKGEFKSWKDNKERRAAYLKDLVQPMCLVHSHVVTLDVTHFKRINERYLLREKYGGAYGLANTLCADRLTERIRKHHPEEIGYFPEDGDAGQAAYKAAARRMGRLVVPIPKKNPSTGKTLPVFQALDFIAYEWRLTHDRVMREERRAMRESFLELWVELDIRAKMISASDLKRLCADQEIPIRN
jgi:hypothetical protein